MATLLAITDSLIFKIILLLVGFVLLIKGADIFVEGSSSIAKKLKVPPLIIGMTIVAMGTSLPEAAVSIAASMNNANSLAVSNVVGSNIFNLMMVLGTCALFNKLRVSNDVLKRDYPFSIICAVLMIFLGVFGFLPDGSYGMNWEIGREAGIIYLVLFIAFITVLIISALKARKKASETGVAAERSLADEMEDEVAEHPVWKSILFIILGAVAIKFGGDWVVDGATAIASAIGVSDTIIGLTICAVGTSLPELVTSIVAARKNQLDMAIGNVVGSNVFNILFVLGLAATISPIPFSIENVIDIGILIFFSVLIYIFCITKKAINKIEGAIMVALYVLFMVYVCLRETGMFA
ncbi:MAG: calcium/sodium antiporter [Lachnospiraceae bacterium]|nr:calcium/sodium antiporter [Lachnospiraceae bacterium]